MESLWKETEAKKFVDDPLKMRVYTSRLLGQEEDLVLHGGGNTSVKVREKNIFGQEEEILYVKGSGWDLGTIQEAGFAPVKMTTLLQMAQLEALNDMDMVKNQRAAMTNPSAPNPSVEAILHAIIPYTYVDHTHADAVVTITNTADGPQRIKELYGDKLFIVPYVMPGFILAQEIYKMTKDLDWDQIEGMILLNHGVFTFNNDPKHSYEKMIEIVSQAEDYLRDQGVKQLSGTEKNEIDTLKIAELRQQVSEVWGMPILAKLSDSDASVAYSKLPNVDDIASRGPLTPDHIIRTKRTPLILLSSNHNEDVAHYVKDYGRYFDEFNNGDQVKLDPAPRWAIWPGNGLLSFGPTLKHLNIIEDISRHTIKAINGAEQLGGWHALPQDDLFEMEYWVLEQAKLKKAGSPKLMQGKIALVTGAASGIGKACVEKLIEEGAVVAAVDINPEINTRFEQQGVLGVECDVTKPDQMENAIMKTVANFGGLDMLIANAGIFPKSFSIGEMDDDVWSKSMDINVTSQQRLLKLCLPYLELGMDAAVVIVGSKNVPAPGPGASAYSVAKAGLTQLGRVAAMELGPKGIRVNIVHPNAVYDTDIWTDEVLKARAQHYGLTVEEYKTNNVLKVEVTSKDVAELAVTMLGPTFSKITGAQVPIDGGNERVI